MKKPFLLFVLGSAISFSVMSQDYTTAVGIRLGPNAAAISPGITIKHFINETNAVEGIVGLSNGIGVCALYEWHKPVNALDHLQWFAGAGGYAAFRNSSSFIGATGIIGLDYKFEDIPLNISLDWKPELNLISTIGFEASTVGLSARFTF